MADKEINHKISLQGEKEYKAALSDARRNLRTLKSELKAETAELGKNASEQQKNEARAKSLSKQIKEQEKIVATYRAELDEVREKYGDNADAVAKYEQQLNNARATLGNMKSELDGIGQSMSGTGTDAAKAAIATKSFADSLEKIGNVGSSVSGAIEDIFKDMVANAGEIVGKLWGMIEETAQKADDWSDYGDMYGTDAQKIQKYSRAVAAANDSWSDLQATINRIVLGGKGEDITEMLGISGVNYLNDFDYALAVMDRLNQLNKSGADMDNIYEKIFGAKRSEGVMDLVGDWDTIQGYLKVFDGNTTGFGMSDEQLQQMQKVAQQSAEIEQKWLAIQDHIAAAFAPRTLEIQTLASGALDGLAEYLDAGTPAEQEEALQKIRDNVEQICIKIGEAIRDGLKVMDQVGESLRQSEDPVTRAIGEILGNVTDSLEWLVNNQEAVTGALEAIFGIWLIGKLMAVAGQLSSIVANIETIKTFGAIGSGTSIAKAAEAAGAAAGGSWATAFWAAAAKAVPAMAFLATLLTPAGTDGDYYDEAGNLYDKNGKQLETAGGETGSQRWYVGAPEEEPRRRDSGAMALRERQDLAASGDAVTADQMAAVEGFWDMWRLYSSGMAGESEYDAAWQSMTDAFSGQDELFQRLNSLIDALSEGEDDWMSMEDLPADFWQKVGGQNGGGKDQKATIDGQSMESLAAAVASATEAGAARGVSGITINLNINEVADAVGAHIGRDVLLPV